MATDYSDILLVDGDMDLSTNDIQLITDNLTSLRQRLAVRFNVWQGEWVYNETFGTPWRSYLGVGIKNAKSAIDAEIKRQVLKEADVTSIKNFTSFQDRTLRTYGCVFEVYTTEGETEALAYFLKDDFEYTVPDVSIGQCQLVHDSILYANKLYKLINFDMKTLAESTWINEWAN